MLYSHTWSHSGTKLCRNNLPSPCFYLRATASQFIRRHLFCSWIFSCWTVKSCFLWPSSLLQGAKGRDSRPSTRCWTAGRRWGRRRASTRPVQVNLCGGVLFSTRLLYTPRSSRRSSGSLFRPDTRRHKRPQSPASTWSCSTRWRCVEVSHPGQSSSGTKKRKKKRASYTETGWKTYHFC